MKCEVKFNKKYLYIPIYIYIYIYILIIKDFVDKVVEHCEV